MIDWERVRGFDRRSSYIVTLYCGAVLFVCFGLATLGALGVLR